MKSKFEKINVSVHIKAEEGKLENREYENKIWETLNQAGIKIKEKKYKIQLSLKLYFFGKTITSIFPFKA